MLDITNLKKDWALVTDTERANAIRRHDEDQAYDYDHPKVFQNSRYRVYEFNIEAFAKEQADILRKQYPLILPKDGSNLVKQPEKQMMVSDILHIDGHQRSKWLQVTLEENEIFNLKHAVMTSVESIITDVSALKNWKTALTHKSVEYYNDSVLKPIQDTAIVEGDTFLATNARTLSNLKFDVPNA